LARGVEGTPTLFVDGRRWVAGYDADTLRALFGDASPPSEGTA